MVFIPLLWVQHNILICPSIAAHLGPFCAACEHPCKVLVKTCAFLPGMYLGWDCGSSGMCVVSSSKCCQLSKVVTPVASVLILESAIKRLLVYLKKNSSILTSRKNCSYWDGYVKMLAEPRFLMGNEQIVNFRKTDLGDCHLHTDAPIRASFSHRYSLWPPCSGGGWERQTESFPSSCPKHISYFFCG